MAVERIYQLDNDMFTYKEHGQHKATLLVTVMESKAGSKRTRTYKDVVELSADSPDELDLKVLKFVERDDVLFDNPDADGANP
jgi:hypothetical protein